MKTFIVILISFFPILGISQHQIKGVFHPANNYEWVFLYKVTVNSTEYITGAKPSEPGVFKLKMDSTATKGLYKIVYGMPQNRNNFDLIYNGNEDIEFSFDKEKGVEFTLSEENKLLNSYTKSIVLINNTLKNYISKGENDPDSFRKIIDTLEEAQRNYEKAAEGKIVSHFIKASRMYVPKTNEPPHDYYKNLTDHFLDQIDFNNEILQHSDFLNRRVMNYVFSGSSKVEDNLLKGKIDRVAKSIEGMNAKQKLAIWDAIWNQLAIHGKDQTANYLTSSYFLSISKQLGNAETSQKLIAFKQTSIGNQAPDFQFALDEENESKSSLYELDAQPYYLILFWSSTCGHCLKELPKLEEYLAPKLENNLIFVLAIGLEEESAHWEKKIVDFPKWQHIYGQNKWNNSIARSYSVMATPSYYLLDRNKKIIAKPIGLPALKKEIEQRAK